MQTTSLIATIFLLLVLFINPDTTSYSANVKTLKSAQNSTTTTYAAVPDLSFQVKAGKTYVIEGIIHISTIPDSGVKITLDGTATFTTLIIIKDGSSTPVTTFGSDIQNIPVTTTAIGQDFYGIIVVDGTGSLGIQFAQADADGGTTTISPGSYMKLTPTSN